jgi:hypothetical protein
LAGSHGLKARKGEDSGSGFLEVVLGNGRRVRVGSGFEAEVLVGVVRALEGMAC